MGRAEEEGRVWTLRGQMREKLGGSQRVDIKEMYAEGMDNT